MRRIGENLRWCSHIETSNSNCSDWAEETLISNSSFFCSPFTNSYDIFYSNALASIDNIQILQHFSNSFLIQNCYHTFSLSALFSLLTYFIPFHTPPLGICACVLWSCTVDTLEGFEKISSALFPLPLWYEPESGCELWFGFA